MLPLSASKIKNFAALECLLMGAVLYMLSQAWGDDLKGYEMKAMGMVPGGAVMPAPAWSHQPAAIAPPKHHYPTSNPSQSKPHPPGSSQILADLTAICPGLSKISRNCPECDYPSMSLTNIVPHLNDSHEWPREKIADWLDVISMDNPDMDLTIVLKEDDNARADA